MRLYLAGPMTGLPHFNFPLFDEVAASLRRMGHAVVSPAELDDPEDRAMARNSVDGHISSVTKTWGDFLARDVKLLADDGIEGVVVLPDWQKSRGARLETYVAHALCNLPILCLVYNDLDEFYLGELSDLTLWRGWCGERDLVIANRSFGVQA